MSFPFTPLAPERVNDLSFMPFFFLQNKMTSSGKQFHWLPKLRVQAAGGHYLGGCVGERTSCFCFGEFFSGVCLASTFCFCSFHFCRPGAPLALFTFLSTFSESFNATEHVGCQKLNILN